MGTARSLTTLPESLGIVRLEKEMEREGLRRSIQLVSRRMLDHIVITTSDSTGPNNDSVWRVKRVNGRKAAY